MDNSKQYIVWKQQRNEADAVLSAMLTAKTQRVICNITFWVPICGLTLGLPKEHYPAPTVGKAPLRSSPSSPEIETFICIITSFLI